MSLKDEKAADLSAIVAEIGEQVIWNGRAYKAIITSIESSDTLQIGGFGEDYDFTVKIAKASLVAQRPKLHDPIQFDGKTYRTGLTRGRFEGIQRHEGVRWFSYGIPEVFLVCTASGRGEPC